MKKYNVTFKKTCYQVMEKLPVLSTYAKERQQDLENQEKLRAFYQSAADALQEDESEGKEEGKPSSAKTLMEGYLTDKKLWWMRLLYGLTIADLLVLLVRMVMFFITLNPGFLWCNIILITVAAVAPFALWVIASDMDEFNYHRRKRNYLWLFMIHAVLLFSQPFAQFTFYMVHPFLMDITVSPIYPEHWVVNTGRFFCFLPPFFFSLIVFRNIRIIMRDEEMCAKIETFKLRHHIDTRKNKNTAYDSSYITNLETGKVIKIQERDRYTHTLVDGATGTGKTSSILLPSIEQDLRRKVLNDDARQRELLKMVMNGEAVLNFPEDMFDRTGRMLKAFRDSYVVPKEAYQDKYNEIVQKYKTCAVICVGPDNDLSDKVIGLCEAKGIEVDLIDPTVSSNPERNLKYHKYLRGLNPFFVPEGLGLDAEASYVSVAAKNFAEQLKKMNEMLSSDGKSDIFFTSVTETVATNLAVVEMLYWRRAGGRLATIDDFYSDLTFGEPLRHKMEYLEKKFGNCVDRGNGIQSRSVWSEEYGMMVGEPGEETGIPLQVSPWKNTIEFIYRELLSGSKDINSFTMGLRLVVDNYMQNQNVRRVMTDQNPIDLLGAMEDGHVILLNYSIEYGSVTSSGFVLGFQLMFQQAILKRKLPAGPGMTPSPVWVYNDEFARMAGDWADIVITLSRKYGIGSVFALQNIDQMDRYRSTQYIKNLLLSVGNIIVFSRANLTEMSIISQMSGLERVLTTTEMTSSTTMMEDDSPMRLSETVRADKELKIDPQSIRIGDFQDVTYCITQGGRVLEAEKGRVHFINYDKIGMKRDAIEWGLVYQEYPPTEEDAAYLKKIKEDSLSILAKSQELNQKDRLWNREAKEDLVILDQTEEKQEKKETVFLQEGQKEMKADRMTQESDSKKEEAIDTQSEDEIGFVFSDDMVDAELFGKPERRKKRE